MLPKPKAKLPIINHWRRDINATTTMVLVE